MSQSKGLSFEREVGEVLSYLTSQFPDRARVEAQADFTHASRPHRPDFVLEYRFGGLLHRHFIECQDRQRSSQDIADKITAIRVGSPANRYIFVYRDRDYLTTTLAKRFVDMGVLTLHIARFRKFIRDLASDLASLELGAEYASKGAVEVKVDTEANDSLAHDRYRGQIEKKKRIMKLKRISRNKKSEQDVLTDQAMVSSGGR